MGVLRITRKCWGLCVGRGPIAVGLRFRVKLGLM